MMAAMPRKRSAKNGHTAAPMARWVLFMPTIPAKPGSVRVASNGRMRETPSSVAFSTSHSKRSNLIRAATRDT